MGFADSLYQRSPYWLRNVWVSLKGYEFKSKRYGGVYRAEFERLEAGERSSLEALQAEQEKLLIRFVAHAREHSAFYQRHFEGIPEIQSLSQLSQLPILEKAELRKSLDLLKTGPVTPELAEVHTSGTTGTPMTFYFTREDLQARYAVLDQYRAWFGVRNGHRRATFSGRTLKPRQDRSHRYWQMNYALNQRLYSTYDLKPEALPHYLRDLNRFRPRFMDGYPSALYALARLIEASGMKPEFKPKVIFTTAETLEDHQKETMERVFGCPVRNQYASSEGAPFIVECERGGNHFLTYTGVMEILDSQGRPASEGTGVFTSFHTHFMPLIRYRIGDHFVASSRRRCLCGREFPLIERIIGREEDCLIGVNGERVGRLDPVFKKSPASIVRAQIVQRARGEVEVLYVPDEASFRPEHLEVIGHELKARLGESMQVRFKSVREIPLGKNGKFKAVVCEVG